jgi:predicted  nucleic acid-binding Zn-ribbon protein
MDEAHQAKMEQRKLATQIRQLEEEKRRIRNRDPAPTKLLQASKQKVYRALDDDVASFQHPDPRLNDQLSTLRDRHQKINIMLAQNPSNTKNVEILLMLEKAIVDIVAAGKA